VGSEGGGEMRHRFREWRGRRGGAGEVAAAPPGRASGGRRRPGSLTGWAHLSVRGR
jgi:hypothetical protein